MQISHTLNKEFMPERFDTLTVVSLWLVSIGVRLITGNKSNLFSALIMAASMFDCFRFFVKLSRRMARILGIFVFDYTENRKAK